MSQPIYQLETRTCQGGCGKSFRCLPTSTATTARAYCRQHCKKEPLTRKELMAFRRQGMVPGLNDFIISQIERREQAAKSGLFPADRIIGTKIERQYALNLPPDTSKKEEIVDMKPAHNEKSRLSRHIDPSPAVKDAGGRQKLWLECVELAKQQVQELHVVRTKVVKLALKCCEIIQGGGNHWSGHEGVFTVKFFAKEIGLNHKTLHNWITAWRDIGSQLDKGEWKDEDYKYAQRVTKKLGADADKKKRLAEFRKMRDGDQRSYRLGTIIQWSRSHRNFIRNTKGTLARDELLALRVMCEETIKAIDERLKK